MLFTKSLLALVAMASTAVLAQDEKTQPTLNADISTTFPESDVLNGVKLINGRPTNALIQIANNEAHTIRIALVAGSLTIPNADSNKDGDDDALAYQSILRNLTAVQYNLDVLPGESKSLPFAFVQDMHPQDVTVELVVIVTDDSGRVHKMQASKDRASIVEAPVNFFDLQIIFLYLVLSAVFAAVSYYVYKTWLEALFPAPTTKRAPLANNSGAPVKVAATTTAADSTGKTYDESWIPEHHISRPVGKRVRGKMGE